jgi:ferredoxin--NADP+ reductase
MYRILRKEVLSDFVILFEIEAREIAKKAKAGNFFVLRIHEQGERIPLTIADFDRDKGTITTVFQKVGKTTHHLATREFFLGYLSNLCRGNLADLLLVWHT